MKKTIIALNSSYVHTNMAVRNLAALCDCSWMDYHINQNLDEILENIYKARPQVAAFSCYIWNISQVLKVAQNLKKILPSSTIVLGGPEISYAAYDAIQKHQFIDAIVCGEGEKALPAFFSYLEKREDSQCLPSGVLLRTPEGIIGNDKYNVIDDLSMIPEPFINDAYDSTKIYYYESSRGCPYSCAYCLSGDTVPLREKPLKQVFADMKIFEQKETKLVKFTDRTFNANRERAKKILRYIAKNDAITCYHFEIALDLMDDEMLDICATLPENRVQMEAGVQSCNEKSLAAVVRKTDISKVKSNAIQLLGPNNIHLHLDLISGLPYEGIASFEDSFNQIFMLYPHYLQLGFLKILKGSKLFQEVDKFGIVYREYPPYEVLCTEHISADDLFLLQGIEMLLGRYFNKGRARGAIRYLTENQIVEPFEYFKKLHSFCVEHDYTKRSIGAKEQFEIVISHAKQILLEENYRVFLQHLKNDYIHTRIKGRVPQELKKLM